MEMRSIDVGGGEAEQGENPRWPQQSVQPPSFHVYRSLLLVFAAMPINAAASLRHNVCFMSRLGGAVELAVHSRRDSNREA
uniref:Uncharacterized protein n=1 Tax=Oryza meridionalis TaxID=40149 RepID=A0A0E0D805_9ORYZ